MTRPWTSHYDPGVPPTLDYPAITLPEMFERTARQYPDRPATIFFGAARTYEQLWHSINSFASGLQRAGIRRGDRLALLLPNCPQFVIAFFGALRAGAVVVPTNPLYTQHELEYQLADSGASAVVTHDALFPRVQAALPNTCVRLVVAVNLGTALPARVKPLFRFKQWQEGVRAVRRGGIVVRFEDILRDVAHATEVAEVHGHAVRHISTVAPPEGRAVDVPKHGSEDPRTVGARPARPGSDHIPSALMSLEIHPDDLAVLQYTGGTTGTAKGAMLSHRNLVSNALQAQAWHGPPEADCPRVLCALPFFHVYGLSVGMNLAVAGAATMILVPRFIPKEVAEVARKYRPQTFPGVPTMYLALSNLPGFSAEQFGSLRVCISGAAPLPAEVQRRFEQVSDVRLVEGYGLTEASPVTHSNPLHGSRPGTVGVPFPDTDAMITDPITWEPLPAGTVGEMTVSGPQVMQGYWNRPEDTAAVLRNGWLHTGDMAVVDEEGFFRIVDRKKDVIIASGFKVYPREVEEVLFGHSKIREACVVGVPNSYRGETVKAFIVPRAGETLTAEEVIAFCREELAPFKVPKIVEFRSELPKSLVGKVLRRSLREEDPTLMEASQA